MRFNNTWRWLILLILLVFLFVLDLSLGSVAIPFGEITRMLAGFDSRDSAWSAILFEFRMPKAVTCVLAGSALALGGLQMQTLFRNPLAGPDVLGLTSGASLAVSLIFMGGLWLLPGPWSVAIAASAGSGVVFVVMIAIARKVQDNVSLLIVGLMVGAGTASIVSVMQYLSRAEEMQVYILWTFGSLGGMNWVEIQVLTLILLIGTFIAIGSIKSLNAWLLGDLYARSLGINLSRARLLSIFSTSLLTGGVTAFCGPIAFVGIAVPHLVKLLLKTNDHKLTVPGSLAGGAALMLGCDILTQTPGGTHVLPINAITALIGAPVVIWVIIRQRFVRS